MAAKTYRPEELADTLKISGKIVRAYLRKTYKRPASQKGSTWTLTAKQANDTLKHFRSRTNAAKPKPKRTPKPKPVASNANANEVTPPTE